MAKSNEIVQIEQIDKGLTGLNNTINKTAENYLKLVKSIADGNKAIQDNTISFEQLSKKQKETADQSKQLDALDKQLITSEQRLKQIEDTRLQTIIKNRLETQKSTKEITLKIKAQQAEKGSTEQLSAVNAILEQRLRKVNQTTDQGKKSADLLRSAIDKNNVKIKEQSSALGAQRINIGNYKSALDGLPGSFGAASRGAISLGKQLWALVANPIGAVIAAIVLAVTGLYKAFTSTDEGATAFAGALKAIKNVLDILLDRLWSYYKLLGSIITFDWEGIKKNGQDAFGGIASAIKDAALAGWNYEQQMDRIKDAESASLIRSAKLRKEIEELTVKSKDRSLGYKEQIRLSQLALDKSLELNNIEKKFQEDRTKADFENLAAKINIDGATIDSKRKMLDEWLYIDDLQLQAERDNNKAFGEFYNLNETAFQELQKAKAADIAKETELITETRRLRTAQFTFEEQLRNEEKAAKKKADDEEKKRLEDKAKLESDISKDLKKDLTDLEKESSSEIDKLIDQDRKIEDRALKESIDANIEANKKILESAKDRAKKEKELEKDLADLKTETLLQGVESIFQINESANQKKFEQLETEKQQMLSNDKLTSEQREKIEADFALKQQELQQKQKVANKIQSAVDIGIKTAKSIFEIKAAAAVLLSNPLTAALAPLALAQIPFVLASSGLALASVAAFNEGTENAPDRFIAGDKKGGGSARELMFLRDGSVFLVNEPTYFEGSKFKGAQIKSNPETEKIISQTEHSGFHSKNMTDERILKALSGVEKAIERKPVAIYNEKYQLEGFKSGNHTEIHLNRIFKHKSI